MHLLNSLPPARYAPLGGRDQLRLSLRFLISEALFEIHLLGSYMPLVRVYVCEFSTIFPLVRWIQTWSCQLEGLVFMNVANN